MSTAVAETFPVRFIATYQMMGDLPGTEWMNGVIEHIKEHPEEYREIDSVKVLTSEPGIHGLQFIVFTFDAKIPDMGYDQAKERGLDLAAEIVGETDVEVLWVTSLVGRENA